MQISANIIGITEIKFNHDGKSGYVKFTDDKITLKLRFTENSKLLEDIRKWYKFWDNTDCFHNCVYFMNVSASLVALRNDEMYIDENSLKWENLEYKRYWEELSDSKSQEETMKENKKLKELVDMVESNGWSIGMAKRNLSSEDFEFLMLRNPNVFLAKRNRPWETV